MLFSVFKFVNWQLGFVLGLFFFIINLSYLFSQEDCFECHGSSDFATVDEAGNKVSLFVDVGGFANSIHGELGCIVCHVDGKEIPHKEKLKNVDCTTCHEEIQEEYKSSIHALAKRKGIGDAPTCVDCHGKHDILSSSNPESRIYPLNLASTCATCHSDPKIVKKYSIPIPNPLEAYKNSVHAIAFLYEQNFNAATCNSCHGSHDIRTMKDPNSSIYWKNVPETCGQCHGDILEQYTASVHWAAAKRGVREAPVCTDCHGEHENKSPENPESLVRPLKVSATTCGRCHASELITKKYGLSEKRIATFKESYHGLTIKGGSLAVANCASCHGIHNILPSSDSRSLIYPANLAKSCGQCHENPFENVTRGPVHLTAGTATGRIVQFVKTIYLWMIIIVIGIVLLHNGGDLIQRTWRIIQNRRQG